MGTHPIFESDFDCLTEIEIRKWEETTRRLPHINLNLLTTLLMMKEMHWKGQHRLLLMKIQFEIMMFGMGEAENIFLKQMAFLMIVKVAVE